MDNFLSLIRKELTVRSDEQRRISGERFFKEAVKLYGMKASVIRQIAIENWVKVNYLPKADILSLCEELWKSGYFEEAAIAVEWTIKLGKQMDRDDFSLYEHWVDHYVTNWASCDTLCNHPVGDLVMKFPAFLTDLKRWTASPNRWKRRASAVSLIIPARRGLFLEDILEIADLLLTDRDDMVQKGYGWMLKAASEAHRDDVFAFIQNRKQVMPRTSLRYAIEKMPEELRKAAMIR